MPSHPPPRPSATRLLGAVAAPLQAFFRLEAASGIALLACAVAALLWANLDAGSYRAVVGLSPWPAGAAARVSLKELVNDGLMTAFFLLVGMEIKRELSVGELRTPGRALLPLVAAAGGMLLPALVYLALNAGGPGRAGWGIPVATDIAFTVGVLSLLRRRVPHALLVFVTALAIFDDIGGIVVIALFYGAGVRAGFLLLAAALCAGLSVLSWVRVGRGLAQLAFLPVLWIALHWACIHPTLAGVAVGLAVPAQPGPRGGPAPVDRLLPILHPWVAFGVMPLFALLNTGVAVRGHGVEAFFGPVSVGAGLGLLAGKTVGIFTFTTAAVRLGLAPLPGGAGHARLLGASAVAGIGFTVALFVAGLAFPRDPSLLDEGRVGVLVGSLAAGFLGAVILLCTRPLDPSGARRDAP